MYNQSFSPSELYVCATQAERRNSGQKKEDLVKAIDEELDDSLIDSTYQFEIKQLMVEISTNSAIFVKN